MVYKYISNIIPPEFKIQDLTRLLPLLQIELDGDNAVVRAIIGEPLASTLDQDVATTIQTAIVQQQVSQLYGQGTLNVGSRTGGPGSWGGCVEDEIARLGAECGISINY